MVVTRYVCFTFPDASPPLCVPRPLAQCLPLLRDLLLEEEEEDECADEELPERADLDEFDARDARRATLVPIHDRDLLRRALSIHRLRESDPPAHVDKPLRDGPLDFGNPMYMRWICGEAPQHRDLVRLAIFADYTKDDVVLDMCMAALASRVIRKTPDQLCAEFGVSFSLSGVDYDKFAVDFTR